MPGLKQLVNVSASYTVSPHAAESADCLPKYSARSKPSLFWVLNAVEARNVEVALKLAECFMHWALIRTDRLCNCSNTWCSGQSGEFMELMVHSLSGFSLCSWQGCESMHQRWCRKCTTVLASNPTCRPTAGLAKCSCDAEFNSKTFFKEKKKPPLSLNFPLFRQWKQYQSLKLKNAESFIDHIRDKMNREIVSSLSLSDVF